MAVHTGLSVYRGGSGIHALTLYAGPSDWFGNRRDWYSVGHWDISITRPER